MPILGNKKGDDAKTGENKSSTSSEETGKNCPIPAFGDLGKTVKKLFTKGFDHGQYGIKLDTKTESGLELSGEITNHIDTGIVKGALEFKNSWPKHGVKLNIKGTADKKMVIDGSCANLLKGFTLSAGSDIIGGVLSQSIGRIKTDYCYNPVRATLESDIVGFNVQRTTIKGAIVAGSSDLCYMGAKLTYDVAANCLARHEYLAVREFKSSTLMFSLVNLEELQATATHKCNDKVEVGMQYSSVFGHNCSKLDLVGKYQYEKDVVFKAKMNTLMELGVSGEIKLREGIDVTLSSQLQCLRLNEPVHKFGIGLKIEM